MALPSPDASCPLEEKEFTAMVQADRNTEKSLGIINYFLSEKAKKSRVFSRSLYVVKDIKKGDVFTEENVRSIRPEYGLHPKYYWDVLGKNVTKDVERGTPLSLS